MDFTVQRNDITEMAVDAIVLPANSTLREGPGASSAVFSKAGRKRLAKECSHRLHEAKARGIALKPGISVATHAFDLPSKIILHTIVPHWKGGDKGEYDQLCSAYLSALMTADAMGLTSLATPLLAAGNNGFDLDTAIEVATKSIEQYEPKNTLESVTLVVFNAMATQAMKDAGYVVVDVIDQIHVLDQEMGQDAWLFAGAGSRRHMPAGTKKLAKGANALAKGAIDAALAAGMEFISNKENQKKIFELAAHVMVNMLQNSEKGGLILKLIEPNFK